MADDGGEHREGAIVEGADAFGDLIAVEIDVSAGPIFGDNAVLAGAPHGGHFQEMDVQMQDRRMLCGTCLVGKPDRPLANLQGFKHVRIRCRFTGLEVPQPPHRAHHQRLDQQCHHIMWL